MTSRLNERQKEILRESKFQIHFYLDGLEYDTLKRLCNKTGMKITPLMKELIKHHELIEAPPERFYEAMEDLNKIGNNLNQIARIANATGHIDRNYFDEVMKEINEEIQEIKKIVYEPRMKNDWKNMIDKMYLWRMETEEEDDNLLKIRSELIKLEAARKK